MWDSPETNYNNVWNNIGWSLVKKIKQQNSMYIFMDMAWKTNWLQTLNLGQVDQQPRDWQLKDIGSQN